MPATVQTGRLLEVNETARPEPAVAATVTGVCTSVLSASAPGVNTQSPWAMANVRLTRGAAL